ncbi:MAG: rfaG [Thermoleophilia bacterium]|nr:rfaG [Thermoleophilia bacterium]
MLRALLITYYFPPAGGGGVQRVLSWCRHLPEHGVHVTVAAPEEPRWVDVDPTLVVPPSTDVLRTPDPSPEAIIPRDVLVGLTGFERLRRKLSLQPRRFALPDIHRRWRRPAVRAILTQARASETPWQVVVSSSPPETTHLVARDVAVELGIPWVADFRDSWLDLPHLRLGAWHVRLKHALNVRLATRTLRHARAAVTVSAPLADDLRRRHPHLDVRVIENGVEFEDVRRAQSRSAGFRDRGRFVVTYTGNFFGLQSPATFLDAVELAVSRDVEFAEDLQLRFVGGLKPADRDRIARSGILADAVEHSPFLRHDDVLATQHAADLLFFYVAPGRGSQGVFTGKVFEYVASQRPVLAQAPADNVAAGLLERAGLTAGSGALVDPDDVATTADALLHAWRTWRAADGRDGGRVPDVAVPHEVLESVSRERGAERLAELLKQLHA